MEDLKELLKAWQGKKTLMTVFPHPDDESMATGGLLVAAKKMGWKTVVVTLTRGDRGKVFVNPRGLSTGELREEELRKALKILRVDKYILGDFGDGSVKEKEGEVAEWFLKIIREESPGVVITYDHSGVTGHPDHIAGSIIVKNVVSGVSEADRPLLLWSTMPWNMKAWGANPEVAENVSLPTYQLSLGWNWIPKWRAARAHRSQRLGKGLIFPLGLILLFFHDEWYHRVNLSKDYKYKYVEFKI